MRKLSTLLTIIRKYHAASNGVGRKQAKIDGRYKWGMCQAAVEAERLGDITPEELDAVLVHISIEVMNGFTVYLSMLLDTDCPHVVSAWWDNHINELREKGL